MPLRVAATAASWISACSCQFGVADPLEFRQSLNAALGPLRLTAARRVSTFSW